MCVSPNLIENNKIREYMLSHFLASIQQRKEMKSDKISINTEGIPVENGNHMPHKTIDYESQIKDIKFFIPRVYTIILTFLFLYT